MIEGSLTLTITGTTPAAAGSAAIGSVVDTATADGAGHGAGLSVLNTVDAILAALGATGGTLDLVLQTSPDNVTWTDFVHFAQVAAAAPAAFQRASASRNANTAPAAVGQATTTKLAASAISGAPQRYMRLVAEAGAGTSAGAAQTLTLIVSGQRKQAA